MKSFEELEELVVGWALAKGIISPTETQTNAQLRKVDEELAEFKQALQDYFGDPSDENYNKCRLELGDVMVTLVVSSNCADLDIVDSLEQAYEKIKNRTGKIINGQFVKDGV